MNHDAPIINLDDLIGYKFVKEWNGIPQRDIVKEKFDAEGNFIIEFINGGEDLLTYNDIINIYNYRYYDVKKLWTYEKII